MVTSHFSIMVEELSQMFVAGPPVVKRVGEDLTKEELGGSTIHSKNKPSLSQILVRFVLQLQLKV